MGNSKDWLHWTVQVLQIGQSVLKWSSVSNTVHRIHGGCLVAYAHFTVSQLTALQHSGSSGGAGTCTYIGCCTGHSCRIGSTAAHGSQARRPSTTYRWCMVHTQERAGPPNWLTDTAQTLHEETECGSLTNWTELNGGTVSVIFSNSELPPVIWCELC